MQDIQNTFIPALNDSWVVIALITQGNPAWTSCCWHIQYNSYFSNDSGLNFSHLGFKYVCISKLELYECRVLSRWVSRWNLGGKLKYFKWIREQNISSPRLRCAIKPRWVSPAHLSTTFWWNFITTLASDGVDRCQSASASQLFPIYFYFLCDLIVQTMFFN